MPTYSFGENSPLKFEISDKMAVRYNEAVREFLKAQRRFTQKFGRSWDPLNDPIEIRWSSKQKKAWNDFAQLLRDAAGTYQANDIMDDYLVKNAVSTAPVMTRVWGSAITTAAIVGALHVLLRGLKGHLNG